MTSTTALLNALEKHHFDAAIKQLDADTQTAFADSTKFDVTYQGRRYPPKALAGLALEVLTGRAFGPADFKGGEGSPCFHAIRRNGFTIVLKSGVQSRSLIEDVVETLSLQQRYSLDNAADMERHAQLIQQALPAHVYAHIAPIAAAFEKRGFSAEVEAPHDIGDNFASAWVRVFNTRMSPAPFEGWDLVFHFVGSDGRFFATLGCGARIAVAGELIDLPHKNLTEQVAWARKRCVEVGIDTSLFQEQVSLHLTQSPSGAERAVAFAKSYSVHDFNEAKFWADVETLCTVLVEIYSGVQLGKSPMSRSPEERESEASLAALSKPSRRGAAGQGFGLSHPERCAVEERAMQVAKAVLVSRGYGAIKDVSARESFDYSATKHGVEWAVEVKGTTAALADTFFLTAAEHQLHVRRSGQTVLVIVRNVDLDRTTAPATATGGIAEVLEPWSLDDWEFVPTAFQARRKQ